MEKKQILVRQPYAITLARHRLNVHEMRIMLRIIEALQKDMMYGKEREKIQKTLFGNKIIQLQTKMLLPDGSKNYSSLKLALKSLKNKSITLQAEDPKKGKYYLYTGLILRGKYFRNNELIELEIDRELLPSFLALAKNYSQYLLEVVFNASSPNVMKLYQYISHWKDKPQIKVMIENLREWLQLGTKYKKSKDLRERILAPAAKELEAKADVYFRIDTPIKLGRRIIGWNLRIFRKVLTDKEESRAVVFEQSIRTFLTEHFKLGSKDIEQFNEFIRKPEFHRHIWDAMHRVAKRIDNKLESIKNRRAYMIKTLKNELEEFLPKAIT